MDASTNDLFQSYGKRKRRGVSENRVALEIPENSTREELTAFIRVLAEGEEVEAAAQKYNRPLGEVHGNEIQRSISMNFLFYFIFSFPFFGNFIFF